MAVKQSGMRVKLWVHKAGTNQVLAGQKNATLNRSAETIDSTSKDSEGYWTESVAGFKSWSIDADGAFVESDAAYQILEDSYLNSEPITVFIEFPSGLRYLGSTIITDFPIEAPYDDLTGYSLSLQGTGPLLKTDDTYIIVDRDWAE